MSVWKFAHIEYLQLLWLLLPVGLMFIWFLWWRSRAIKQLGQVQLVRQLMPERPDWKHQLKFLFLLPALAALSVALANPQIGSKYEKVKRQGIDVFIALDVSKSMLAEDVKPNRLDRSRQFISNLIDRLQNDRIGLIVFAGNAYLQMPLTVDYSAAKLFLSTINTDMVPTQGTAIGDAIRLALGSFESEDKKHKAIVIISDGEDHEGDTPEAIQQAVEEGAVIFTLGVGTPKGAPIPVYRGTTQVDFKRDRSNNIVLSKLNETMLQQMAALGNGSYFRLGTGRDEVDALVKEISNQERKDFEERMFTEYDDKFQYFLAIAFFLLVAEFMITEKRAAWLDKLNIFK